MAWGGGNPLFPGLNPLGLAIAGAAAKKGFHNPGDQMFLGMMAQQGQQMGHPALTREIAHLVGIDGFNGTRMNVRRDQHKKHQRNIRDGKVTLGYHQTSEAAARAILAQQQFRAGSEGCVGAGMYFAKCAGDTHPKTANHRGVILVADVRLGHRYKVPNGTDPNFGRYQSCEASLNFLMGVDCNSCKVTRASGPEYVVYDPAQVSNIRVHSFCPGGGCIILDESSNEVILGRDYTDTFSDFGGRNEWDVGRKCFQDTDRWQTCVRETCEESLGMLSVAQPPFTRRRDVVVHLPGLDPIDQDSGYKCYLVSVPSTHLHGFCTNFKQRVAQERQVGRKVEVSECVRFPVANIVETVRGRWRKGDTLKSKSGHSHAVRGRCKQILSAMVQKSILQ